MTDKQSPNDPISTSNDPVVDVVDQSISKDDTAVKNAESGSAKPSDKGTPSSGKPAKPKKQNLLLSLIMNITTLGIWSRFRPRKGGWNGTWGLTTLFLAVLSTGLIAERFFKPEVNALMKDHMAATDGSAMVELPDRWSWEGEDASLKKITALEIERDSLAAKLAERSKANQSQSAATSELKRKLNIAEQQRDQAQANAKKAQDDLVALQATTSTETSAEPVVITAPVVAPKISHATFADMDAEVGCSSRYSSERQKDLFAENYQGRWVSWTGKIAQTDREKVQIALNDSDASLVAYFETENAGYDLLRDDDVSLTFQLETQGSCETPFVGKMAVIN